MALESSPPLVVNQYQGCVDVHGQSIPHGLLFAPGPDECLVCTCFNGTPGLCRTMFCAPPSNCKSIRMGDGCCEWICLEKYPDGHDEGGDGDGVVAAADVNLRLVASAVTAICSVTLLFFLIYRLRKKKRQRRSGGDSHDDAMSMDSQLPPPHSLAAVATDVYPTTVMPPPPHANPAPPPSTPRSYWLSWWKPSSTNEHVFDARPAPPPSYDAAMTLAHPDVRARSASNRGGEFDYYDYEDEGAERGEDDDDDGSVSGNSLAPPYSQIHLDPIIPDWVNPVTSRAAAPAGDPNLAQTPAPCSLPPPRVPDAASFPTSGLPETARNRRQHAQCRGQGARAGAALVLPVLPPTFGATTVAVAARRPSSQMESRQVGRRGEGEGGHCHHHTASSSSSGRRLVNLSARSREGIVALPPSLPPREHDASDAALQRLSLPLHLNISDSSDSSGPALEVVETAQDDSPASST